MESRPAAVTVLLKRMSAGDPRAAEELVPAVYAELRVIATRRLRREREGHTLQPTALVNEAWLRIFGNSPPPFSDRAHFLATASTVMRRILVDHARARSAAKRGGPNGDVAAVPAEAIVSPSGGDFVDLLNLHDALEALSVPHPGAARSLEMHYFGGMTLEEIAAATAREVEDIREDLRLGRAWLRRRLNGTPYRETQIPRI